MHGWPAGMVWNWNPPVEIGLGQGQEEEITVFLCIAITHPLLSPIQGSINGQENVWKFYYKIYRDLKTHNSFPNKIFIKKNYNTLGQYYNEV